MTSFILEQDGIAMGPIHVRLARNQDEIRTAQELRYDIFYREFGARPVRDVAELERDYDHFDNFADHLVVIDSRIADPGKNIIGTYRLLGGVAAKKAGRFYTAAEFDISPLTKGREGLLEMGRSCVHKDYRTRPVLQLLWQGIAEYVSHHNVKFLFGCASFHGTDPDEFALGLSYLYHNHLAPADFRPKALDDIYVSMNRIPNDRIDPKQALKSLPALVKGYLRIGGFVGDGAYVDTQFNTVDVCVVLKTSLATESYLKHYERKTGGQFDRE